MAETWLKCSACRKEIGFNAVHWVCSVSTCNRNRTRLVFCTVACWDSHLGEARHREAWANEARSPSKEAWARELAEQPPAPSAPAAKAAPVITRPAAPQQFATRLSDRPTAPPARTDESSDDAPRRPPDSVQFAVAPRPPEVDEDAPFAMRRPVPPEPVRLTSPAADATSRHVAPPPPSSSSSSSTPAPRRVVVGEAAPAPAGTANVQLADNFEREILIVVSKMKKYIRERSGMNCSDAVAEMLSEHVRLVCDDSIRAAARDDRKTVLDRDVPRPRR